MDEPRDAEQNDAADQDDRPDDAAAADAAEDTSDAAQADEEADEDAPAGTPTEPEPKAGFRLPISNEALRIIALGIAAVGVALIGWTLLKSLSKTPPPEPLPDIPDAEVVQYQTDEDWEQAQPTPPASAEDSDSAEPAQPAEATQTPATPSAEAQALIGGESVNSQPAAPQPQAQPKPVRSKTPSAKRSRRPKREQDGELVRVKPVPPIVPAPSAYEQLMMRRRAAQGRSASATGEMTDAARQSIESSLANASRAFIRFLVEDAANIPARVGEADWEALRNSPRYGRVLTGIYDFALDTDDKVSLYAAYAAARGVPESAPPALRGLQFRASDLTTTRERIWQRRMKDIRRIVQSF